VGALETPRLAALGAPLPPQRKDLRRFTLTRDKLDHAAAPQFERRPHLLRIAREIVVSALDALLLEDLALIGDVAQHGVTETEVDDVRRRNPLIVHRGAAVTTQIVMRPVADARTLVEGDLRLPPSLVAAIFAGAEHRYPALVSLLIAAP